MCPVGHVGWYTVIIVSLVDNLLKSVTAIQQPNGLGMEEMTWPIRELSTGGVWLLSEGERLDGNSQLLSDLEGELYKAEEAGE